MRRQTEADLPYSRRCVRGLHKSGCANQSGRSFLLLTIFRRTCVMAPKRCGKVPKMTNALGCRGRSSLKRCEVTCWLFRLVFVLILILPVIIIGWRVGRFWLRLLLRWWSSVRRHFAILLLASRLAAADVIYLLRFQRTSWVILHRALLLCKRRILLWWRIFSHQRTTVLWRAIRLTARIL